MSELQLVYRERTYVVDTDDVGITPASSDSQVKDIIERHFDLGTGALHNHQVTRPGGRRILVSEKAVFGSP